MLWEAQKIRENDSNIHLYEIVFVQNNEKV